MNRFLRSRFDRFMIWYDDTHEDACNHIMMIHASMWWWILLLDMYHDNWMMHPMMMMAIFMHTPLRWWCFDLIHSVWCKQTVTAIHMTVTAVWYDMTNDSNRLMTLTVLTQWDAWQIEYDMWIDEASWAEVNEHILIRELWPAVKMMSSVDEQLTNNNRDEQTLMTWQYWRAGVDEQRRLRSGCSSIDESVEQMISSIDQQQNRLKRKMMLMWTVSLNCKCKLDLHLRLGYLKPFLAGSKKTRQGPRWRVGALCISRCWFCLTVVAEPKLI